LIVSIDDDPSIHESPAYREIVRRHGTQVTLGQVLDTLLDMGWEPPEIVVPEKPGPRSVRPPPAKLETCHSCGQTVNPVAAVTLCRHPTVHCPYKAARR
jgi:hypothetical protein